MTLKQNSLLKKKDFEGKSNSEIQRKITQNAHKIWILLQANQFEYNATHKKKIAESSAETSFSITFPTETKADHNNMKDPKHWSTQLGKRTSAHQSQQVSNGTHTLKKQTLRNNMALGI